MAGWQETGDLSGFKSREDLRQYLQEVYPDASSPVLANWTGQLWRFAREIDISDLVVMPLKTSPGRLAIGKVTGAYVYDDSLPVESRHTRSVEWLQRAVTRDSVRSDLRDSLGSLLTVCELKRHNAAVRIGYLANGEPDPGWAPSQADDDQITDLETLYASALDEGRPEPLAVSVRHLLSLWGTTRRTDTAVIEIESALADHGLVPSPSLGEGWLDNVVKLLVVRPAPEEDAGLTVVPREGVPTASMRVGNLECANRNVESVLPTDSLVRATSLMVAHDYSQLAIIDEEGKLTGTLSWESIGRASLSHSTVDLSTAREAPRTVGRREPLLKIISEVSTRGYVFVADEETGEICGIVTVSDLTEQFGVMARPFALIEEAERRLRRRVDETFAGTEIKRAARGGRGKLGAAALTLGNYPFLLKAPSDFEKLGWRIDHELFIAHLEMVCKLRNDLMHFSTDPLASVDLSQLESFVSLLRSADPRP